ncbi:MAG: hypothetical protein U5K71_14765 [Gracilimonas sp.]|nr:hypothetical protein [Gracilimonas sp.]
MPSSYSEDASVEQRAIDIFEKIDWNTINAIQAERGEGKEAG